MDCGTSGTPFLVKDGHSWGHWLACRRPAPARCKCDISRKNWRPWREGKWCANKHLNFHLQMQPSHYSTGRKRWKANDEKMVDFWCRSFSRFTQSFFTVYKGRKRWKKHLIISWSFSRLVFHGLPPLELLWKWRETRPSRWLDNMCMCINKKCIYIYIYLFIFIYTHWYCQTFL